MSTLNVVFWSQAAALLFGVGVSLVFPAGDVETADLVWGGIAGLVGTVGIFALYRGLAFGRMAVVSPLAGLLSALIPLALGVALGERPQGIEWAGVLIALPAIWLVAAGESSRGRGSGVAMGLLAGLGFGLFFAAISQAGDAAGFWPLVGARAASVSLMTLVVIQRREEIPVRRDWFSIFLVGIGDILANVFLLVAYRSGLISLTSVLTSLYPAVTVLLAVLLLDERLTRRQLDGLFLALLAVTLIAI
jgi:drug/metabolite transporter (DMT)-like permease